jgi:putative flippase GtrA
VHIARTIVEDLRGITRLSRQLGRFAVVGIASTLAYAVLFLLLRPVLAPQAANATALVLTAVANTAANRRWTFGVRGRRDRITHHLQALLVLGAGLAVTSWALRAVTPLEAGLDAGGRQAVEIVTLTTANLLVTAGRFLAMRAWIFRRLRPST